MANSRSGNVYYVDTAYTATVATLPELAISNLRVHYIIITSSSTNAICTVTDNGTSKLDLRATATHQSEIFDFSEFPINFTTSIRITTLTNCTAMIVFEEVRR